MVRIREDNKIDFTDYTLFEMLQAFWVDCIKSRNKNFKYYWQRLDYRKKLIKALEKNWSKDLPNFELFIICIKDLRSGLDPTVYSDSELYLAELMAINDELKKNELERLKRRKKNYRTVKPFCW